MKALVYLFVGISILLSGCKSNPDTNEKSEQVEPKRTLDSAAIKQWDSIKTVNEGIATNNEIETPISVDSISRVPIKLDDAILNRYTGTYELLLDPSLEFTITNEKGYLYFSSQQTPPVQFYAETDSIFFNDPNSPESLIFWTINGEYNMILKNKKGQMMETRRHRR